MFEKEEIVQIKYQGHVFTVDRYGDLIGSDFWIQFPGDSGVHQLYKRPFDDGFYHVSKTISPCQVVQK